MIASPSRASASPASLFLQLQGLRDTERFQHIWLDANWLDDAAELRRDHKAIETLTRFAAETDSTEQARDALQLAIRLLRLHANSGCAALRALRTSVDYVLLLAEQIETQLAERDFVDDPVLIARLAALRMQNALLARAEHEYCSEMRRSGDERARAFALSPQSLRLRSRMLGEAEALMRRAARPHF